MEKAKYLRDEIKQELIAIAESLEDSNSIFFKKLPVYIAERKIRLDTLLVERGLCDDLQRATSLILSGSVIVNGEKITKAGFKYSKDAKLEVLDRIPENVSRGALKLKSAFKAFEVNSQGKVCVDFGASTGGFTEVLLLGGAEKVFAFDVGYGQMASRLQNNSQ